MGRILCVANQKGGVGKTTTAVNLSASLAAAEQRVLLVDIDPQANATSALGVQATEDDITIYEVLLGESPLAEAVRRDALPYLDLVPSANRLNGAEVELVPLLSRETRLQRALAPVLANYAYVVVDCPPSLGLLTINALTAADDGVIVPIQCEYLALEGLGRLWQTIQLVRENLNPDLTIFGMVLTMFDVRTNLAAQVVKEVRSYFPDQTFATVVPRSVRLSEAPSYGEPVATYAPNSPGALAYHVLDVMESFGAV